MKQLIAALKQLPVYTVNFIIGMLVIVITDPIITSLLIGAVALGFATNALVAVATFMLMYVIIKTVNTVANAIGGSGITLRGAVERLALALSKQTS